MENTRLKTLIHYISRKMAMEPDKLGAVKLQKILWYTDIKSYRIKGELLTGASYIKNSFGPYINALDDVVNELVRESKITTRTAEYFNYDKREFIGIGTPDISAFEDREIRWIDESIESICYDHTAGTISDKSHDAMWEGAEMYAPLPISAAAIRFMSPSDESIAWAKRELGSL